MPLIGGLGQAIAYINDDVAHAKFKKGLYHTIVSKNAVKNLLQLHNTPSLKVDALIGLLLTSSQLIKLIFR